MKSEVKNIPAQQKYPCLKQSTKTDNIVLFTSKDAGVLVFSSNLNIGTFGSDWEESYFIFFDGVVELSN